MRASEHSAKIAHALTGVKHTPERIANLKRHHWSLGPNADETREKIRVRALGRKMPRCRPDCDCGRHPAIFRWPDGTECTRSEWRSAQAAYPADDACELCGGTPAPGMGLCLDHDHATGHVRGWLCQRCNSALGSFGDTIEGLERALRYLRQGQRFV